RGHPADVEAPPGDRGAQREPGVESLQEQPAGRPLPARARGLDRRLPRSLQLPLPVPLRLRRQRGAVEERRIRPPPPARPLRARYPAALRALRAGRGDPHGRTSRPSDLLLLAKHLDRLLGAGLPPERPGHPPAAEPLAGGRAVIRFVLRRILGIFPILLVVFTFSFVLMRVAPGGPFDAEKPVPPEVKRNLELRYRMREPWCEARFLPALQGVRSPDEERALRRASPWASRAERVCTGLFQYGWMLGNYV